MIITKKKTFEGILKNLENRKSVYLFGCNSCAQQCNTGGETELKEFSRRLKENGIEVRGESLIDETCYSQLVKKEFRKNESIKKADAIVVLACGAGVKTVADIAPTNQPVLPALDTIFLAKVERVGRFFEGCSLCGDCILDRTAGICPHTECPKGLLNGPCGGVANGMCEADTKNECAWVRIYKRLESQNRISLMEEFSPPKDHSVSLKPRSVCLSRARL